MDKNEFNRLERAFDKFYKKGNKQALYDWGNSLEEQLIINTEKKFNDKFKVELSASIDAFLIAMVYTLHFSESTKFGKKRLKSVMDDIVSTVDMFSTGEYSPEEYLEILKKDNINIENIRKGIE